MARPAPRAGSRSEKVAPSPGRERTSSSAAVIARDVEGDREAEAGPLVGILGGEERIEDPLVQLARNAGAVVASPRSPPDRRRCGSRARSGRRSRRSSAWCAFITTLSTACTRRCAEPSTQSGSRQSTTSIATLVSRCRFARRTASRATSLRSTRATGSPARRREASHVGRRSARCDGCRRASRRRSAARSASSAASFAFGTGPVGLGDLAQALDLHQVRADEGERVVHLVRDPGRPGCPPSACAASGARSARSGAPRSGRAAAAYWPTGSPRASRTGSALSSIRRSSGVASSARERRARLGEAAELVAQRSGARPPSAGVSSTAASGRWRSDAAGAPRIASAAGLRSRIAPTASASTTPSGRCSITSRRVSGSASRRRSRKTSSRAAPARW